MNIFQELGLEQRDALNEEIAYNIASTYNIISGAVNAYLSKFGLSASKFNIMMVVKHIGKDNGLPQNEISRRLLVTTSNMTRMVDKLEKDGYVQRLMQEGDRRVKLIKITKKGSLMLDKIWPGYTEKMNDLMGPGLSNRDKKKINELLEKLKEIIKDK